MWGQNKKPKQTAHIDSLIGQNTEIHGDVIFSGNFTKPELVLTRLV